MSHLVSRHLFVFLTLMGAGLCTAFSYKDVDPPRPAPDWHKLVDLGPTDARLKGYRVPEGVKVEIVAEAPTVINPVGMTFAEDGTPLVIEWLPSPGGWREEIVEFPCKDGSKRKVAVMRKGVKDVIKALQVSKDGESKEKPLIYDKARVILEEELPSTFLLHDGWLYTASQGSVRRWKQSKEGGTYDVKETIAHGFSGFGRGQVSGLTIGNDGWLYITAGDDDNRVEGSDGSRATVLRSGAVFRCKPDGSKLELFAQGFRNPYGNVAFDAAFQMFHLDAGTGDASPFGSCRVVHVAEGNDFGWRLRAGARFCEPDQARIASAALGTVPPLVKTGRGSPAGLVIYNESFFPERYRGLLYYPDPVRRSIRAYKVGVEGASFEVAEEFALLKSDDPLFRPCQMVVGPDGAMYVVDRRMESDDMDQPWGDGKNGRIYQLSWGGTREHTAIAPRARDSWAKIRKLSEEELLRTLRSENFSDRQVAQRELIKRGEKNRAVLIKLLEDTEAPAPARLAALGALHSLWNAEVAKAVRGRLIDTETGVRRLAIGALGMHGEAKGTEVVDLLDDGDLDVRRSAALALARTAAPGSADTLVNALAANDRKDRVLHDGLVRAVEMLGKTGIERLVSLFESGDKKQINLVADTFLRLRTRPAAEVIPRLLTYPHLSSKQRADLVRSYNNYQLDPPVKLDPVLDYVLKKPDEALEVKLAGLEVLALGRALKSERAQKWLLTQLHESDPGLRLAALRAVQECRATLAAPLVMKLLADEKRSLPEREAAARALGALENRDAVPVLKEILGGKEDNQSILRSEALRSLFALDPDAGKESTRQALSGTDPNLQVEAIRILGLEANGAKQVARLFLDKKLPRERMFLEPLAEVLGKHVGRSDREADDLQSAVRKVGLSIAMKPANLAGHREAMKTKGSEERGRKLYWESSLRSCNYCHRIKDNGGRLGLGPDLSDLGQSRSPEKLIEKLIEPSKEIRTSHRAHLAITKKKAVYLGLKVGQDATEVVLREASGREVRLALQDVKSLEFSKTSLMPFNVVSLLSYDQFIDLLTYLRSLKQ